MRIGILVFILLISCFAHATTYYISPTGDNNNSGDNILTPWATWERISAPRWNNILLPGDIVYIRGGVYSSPYSSAIYGSADGVACYWLGIQGQVNNYIMIQNYPGELPILDCSNVAPVNANPFIITMRNCAYVHVKGLHLRNLAQICCNQGFSRGFEINNSHDCILEQIEVDHIGGSGFLCFNSNDILYKNCDSHHNADTNSAGSAGQYGSADGFSRANTGGTNCVYEGCRAWLNSDDGWDNLLSNGTVTFRNCWSFWNGYYEPFPGAAWICAGDGAGYKLGPPTDTSIATITTRFMNNCLAFENKYAGFDQNGTSPTGQESTLYQIYNCTAYKNGSANGDCQGNQFWFLYGFDLGYVGTSGAKSFDLKNNISYANYLPAPFPAATNPLGSDLRYSGSNINNDHNSWDGLQQPDMQWSNAVNITNADFLSVSSVGTDGPRQADGSLPILNFLRLSPSSPLINTGISVGLPFNGAAPDIGAFEFDTSIISIVSLKLYLQGYYIGAGKMEHVLMNQHIGSSTTETDTITIEMHGSTYPYSTVSATTAVLNTNGTISVGFPSVVSGSYSIAIRHRNTIQTWSATPVTVGSSPVNYDFSTAANMAYGDNQAMIETGVWAMYTGDLNQDNYIDGNDFPQFNLDNNNSLSGEYAGTDMNGDGFVDGNDFPVFDINSSNSIVSLFPQ